MALLKCFLPIYPLGHRVSEMSSTGITRGFGFASVENENLLLEMLDLLVVPAPAIVGNIGLRNRFFAVLRAILDCIVLNVLITIMLR